MGSKRQAESSRETAKRMKELGIRRTTGACPMGCGAQIPIGGNPLIAHLGRCGGAKRR